jgi:hypothetical protein
LRMFILAFPNETKLLKLSILSALRPARNRTASRPLPSVIFCGPRYATGPTGSLGGMNAPEDQMMVKTASFRIVVPRVASATARPLIKLSRSIPLSSQYVLMISASQTRTFVERLPVWVEFSASMRNSSVWLLSGPLCDLFPDNRYQPSKRIRKSAEHRI